MIKKLANTSQIEFVEYYPESQDFKIKIYMVSGRVFIKQFKTQPEADNFYSNLKTAMQNTLEFN